MAGMNLKRSLFGYTRSSVYNYITEMNRELNKKIEAAGTGKTELIQRNEELSKEVEKLTEKQTELLDEISKYIKEQERLTEEIENYKSEIDRLNGELIKKNADIAAASAGSVSERDVRGDIADVIIDAKHFANNLKKKAEYEYAQQSAKNEAKLNAEKDRVEGYIDSINALCIGVRELCMQFDVDMKKKKEQIEVAYSKMDAEKAQ